MFFHISTSAPAQSSQNWGDRVYADDLASAFRDQGFGARVYGLFEPVTPMTAGEDVVIRIAGPHLDNPVPGMVNIAWLISHAERLFPRLLGAYDRVFTSARALPQTGLAAPLVTEFLPQATSGTRFQPRMAPEPSLQVSFVGNYNAERGDRRLILDAAQAGLPLAVWGHGWQGVIAPDLWRGERLDQQGLAAVYAGSRIVLNAHMGTMARLGMMSNRSYDALAAGAEVISDPVAGYTAGDLPGLHIAPTPEALLHLAGQILAAPPRAPALRAAQHDAIVAAYGFATVARRLAEQARLVIARPAPRPRPARAAGLTAFLCDQPGAPWGLPLDIPLCRRAEDLPASGAVLLARSDLVADLGAGSTLHLLLSPPARQLDPDQPRFFHHAERLDRIAQAFAAAPGVTVTPHPPGTAPAPLTALWAAVCGVMAAGPIHSVHADQHRLVAGLLAGQHPDNPQLSGIFTRARSVGQRLEIATPAGDRLRPALLSELPLLRIFEGGALFPGGENGLDRNAARQHVSLPPLHQTPHPARPVGVFVHLYYDELAPVFATELQSLTTEFALYVSTDSAEKAARIAQSLPGAEIRLTANRGRDIYPKLWLFADRHAQHDLVLHLHGKRSPHSEQLDGWLRHNLNSLLGGPGQVNRILSVFHDLPEIGLIAPPAFRPVLPSLHWTMNYHLAAEITRRLGQADPPRALRFPAGSMFWARSAALAPLIDLGLTPEDFPPEARQIDGTLAHALERMIGVTCERAGFRQLFLAAQGFGDFRRYRRALTHNSELASSHDLQPEE